MFMKLFKQIFVAYFTVISFHGINKQFVAFLEKKCEEYVKESAAKLYHIKICLERNRHFI